MIGHGEMMLSSIAERLNCYGQIVSVACATARHHAESLDPCGIKTRQEWDWERAIASLERALADAREVLDIQKSRRVSSFQEAAE